MVAYLLKEKLKEFASEIHINVIFEMGFNFQKILWIKFLRGKTFNCVFSAYAIAGRVDIDFETEPLGKFDGKVGFFTRM